jgi:hypothetical protein
MTNIPRAPFYSPRPAEDQLWSRGPISNRGTLDAASTELKWYGAPGQVPTKSWNRSYTYDDPAVWNIPSKSSQGLIDAVSTELKWYGAPGQVPTKHWYPLYDYNSGELAWQFQFDYNQPLYIPPAANNIPGGVFYYPKPDDPPVWNGKPTSNLLPVSLIEILNLINTTSPLFTVDDPASWQFVFDFNQPLYLATTTSNTIPVGSLFVPNYDDSPVWNGKPTSNLLPVSLIEILNLINTTALLFSADDPATWQWSPQHDLPLNTVAAVSPTTSRQNSFLNDDSTYWQPSRQRSVALPFVPNIEANFWRFGLDDSTSWQPPIQRSIGLPLVPPIQNRYQLAITDDQLWSATIQHDFVLTTVVPSPITSRQSSFFADDSAIWRQPAQRSIGLPLVPPIQNRYRAEIDDPSVWQGSPIFSKTLSQLEFTPTVPRQWLFGYDDPAFWLGHPVSAAPIPMLTVGGIIVPRQWLFGNDDASAWQFAFEYNQTLNAPAASSNIPGGVFYYTKPEDPAVWAGWENRNLVNLTTAFVAPNPFAPVFYHFFADDPAIWVQPPQRSIGLPLVPNIKPNFWSYNNNDAAVSWQQPVQRSIALPFLPPIQNRYQIAITDDQLWALTVQRDLSLINSVTAPSTPTVPRQWLFGSDDASYWVGKPNSAAAVPMLTVGGIIKPKQWNANHDDSAVWSRVWVNRDLINTVTVSNPFIQNPYLSRSNMVVDSLPVWKSPYNQNLYFVAPGPGTSLPLVKFIGNVGHLMIRQ